MADFLMQLGQLAPVYARVHMVGSVVAEVPGNHVVEPIGSIAGGRMLLPDIQPLVLLIGVI